MNENRLRVLITNITLAGRSGTETYVRDLAVRLLRRGHTPIVYTTDQGLLAGEIRFAGAPVVTDLDSLASPPDVIHGHHHPETMTALLRFPGVPGLFVCHDRTAWYDMPPRFPRLLRYVAVDDNCRDRLLYEHAIPEERVEVLLNFVDLERFQPRAPLPTRPARAAVFSNYARETSSLLAVRGACERSGVALDVIGDGVGNRSDRPEEMLGAYDLVFAKARCALEAMAVGVAVVLYDREQLGPLVTADAFHDLRRLNFGRRTLQWPVRADAVAREIDRFDAQDAAEVSGLVRSLCDLDPVVDRFVEIYRAIIAEQAGATIDPTAELVAAAAYQRHLAPFPEIRKAQVIHAQSMADVRTMQYEYERLREEANAVRDDHGRAVARCEELEGVCQGLRGELRAITGSTTFRLHNRLGRLPIAGPGLRRAKRLLRMASTAIRRSA